jgi:hypothetical protein
MVKVGMMLHDQLPGVFQSVPEAPVQVISVTIENEAVATTFEHPPVAAIVFVTV